MQIRPERPEEAEAISALTTHAFATAPHADGTEAQIVEGLRAASALTLSLVADEGGTLLGHVAVSPVQVDGHWGWQGLGPISVLPERQGTGIGAALMHAAVEQLRASGAHGIVLVGDPAFYTRFGFRAAPGIALTGIPPEAILALPFHEAMPEGALRFHVAFGLEY
ncbi:GNAT family N-acetyltransferase [Salipiger sp. PrR002]|uniref:GNAT family N-acetyltransferase n=1 Tax=Salipiger sp. PrR002 TaxID=2706489 RepID=UPI0013B5BC60|nr:N-acetyltransferase [Salipiger sp. PrR002]NDV99351.1 N-acetyltransferase [Salipiger sp. PrR002]NDW55837.1 N-acetyltransferase [Salipiger sp. PrR004]